MRPDMPPARRRQTVHQKPHDDQPRTRTRRLTPRGSPSAWAFRTQSHRTIDSDDVDAACGIQKPATEENPTFLAQCLLEHADSLPELGRQARRQVAW